MKEEFHTFVDLSAFIFTLSSERENVPWSYIKHLYKLKMEEKTANPHTLEGEGGGIRCRAIRICKLFNTNEFGVLYRSHRGPLWMSHPFEFNSTLASFLFIVVLFIVSFSFGYS